MSKLTTQVLSLAAENGWDSPWLAQSLVFACDFRDVFDRIVERLPSHDYEEIKQHFVDIFDTLFSDGRMSRTRVVTLFAFAQYLQNFFSEIDLKEETGSLLERHVFGWLFEGAKVHRESRDFPDSFHNFEWLEYSVLLLLHDVITKHDV